jgi:hypothetical protein
MNELLTLLDSPQLVNAIMTCLLAVIAVAAALCHGRSREPAKTVMYACLVLLAGLAILIAGRERAGETGPSFRLEEPAARRVDVPANAEESGM